MKPFGQIKQSEVSVNFAIFVSLYLILVVFFIMIRSMSQVDTGKFDSAKVSVKQAFAEKRLKGSDGILSINELAPEKAKINFLFKDLQRKLTEQVEFKTLKIKQVGQKCYIDISLNELYNSGEGSAVESKSFKKFAEIFDIIDSYVEKEEKISLIFLRPDTDDKQLEIDTKRIISLIQEADTVVLGKYKFSYGIKNDGRNIIRISFNSNTDD